MLFKATIISTMALVFASQAMGAAINQERATDIVQIATDPGKHTVLLTPPTRGSS
jgi:hypothetical protein